MSHHGSDDRPKALSQAFKEMFGEYPDGRMNESDEGAIPMAVGHENGRVFIQFPRNLNWVGFTPEQAMDIAQTLVEHARACGCKKPLVLKLG